MINWNASKLEYKFAAKIAARAIECGVYRETEYEVAEMDVIACHMAGCHLDLERLLAAERGEFIHDLGGIRKHIDRKTGELGGFFVPRFAESEQQYDADAIA